MDKKLEEMSIIECKSLVYDHLALIENSQKAIQLLNQQIAKLSQPSQNGTLKPELVEPNA